MLSNKIIVVIGGAGKLGAEFTSSIIKNNGKVIVFDICSNKEWEEKKIYSNSFVHCSINDKKMLVESINKTANKYGRIDAIINTSYPRNASWGASFFDVTIDDFNENVSLHLGGYFLVIQEFSRFFITQGHGNIISICSIQGVVAPRFETYKETNMTSPVEYSAIKAAIIHLTRYAAKYLKGKKIRVNCISPGGIRSNEAEIFQKNYKKNCLNKGMLDTRDIIGTVIFLLSDHSKYINGQNIIVDDGFTL